MLQNNKRTPHICQRIFTFAYDPAARMEAVTNLSVRGRCNAEYSGDPDDEHDRNDEQGPSRHDRRVEKKLIEANKLDTTCCEPALKPMRTINKLYLRVGEIAISKCQVLLACISGIKLLVRFSKFARTAEQVPARVAGGGRVLLALRVRIVIDLWRKSFPVGRRLGDIIVVRDTVLRGHRRG